MKIIIYFYFQNYGVCCIFKILKMRRYFCHLRGNEFHQIRNDKYGIIKWNFMKIRIEKIELKNLLKKA